MNYREGRIATLIFAGLLFASCVIALTGCTYQSFSPNGPTRQWSVSLGNKDQFAGPAGASVGTNASFIAKGVVDFWNSPTTQMGIQAGMQYAGMQAEAQSNTRVVELEAEVAELKERNQQIVAIAQKLQARVKELETAAVPVSPAANSLEGEHP